MKQKSSSAGDRSSPTASTTGSALKKSRAGFVPWALRSDTLAVFRGRIQWADPKGYCLIKTRTAQLRVYWAGGVLPPDVFVGDTVSLMGKIVTYERGTIIRIGDALVIEGDWPQVMHPVLAQISQATRDPAEWMDDEQLEKYLRWG